MERIRKGEKMSEEIKELSSNLFQYGGTVIMAVLFIIYLCLDRKDRKEKEKEDKKDKQAERDSNNAILKELSASNRNIAESLNLLKTSMDNTNSEFKQHDERAIKSFQNIHDDLLILKERKWKGND
jgi:hypothetical protein